MKGFEKMNLITRYPEKISGVYLLFAEEDENTCLYVGQSNDINNRIKQHKHIPWKYYSYIVENDLEKRGQLEHEIIKKYSPFYNICKKKIIVDWKKSHFNWGNREERWKALAQLKNTYKDIFDTLSCRQVQALLYHYYGYTVNHNTINNDLKNKNYTPFL